MAAALEGAEVVCNLGADEVDALNREAAAICRGARGAVRGIESSGAELDDDAVMRQYLCIHHPHKISEVARQIMRHPRIVAGLTRGFDGHVHDRAREDARGTLAEPVGHFLCL